MEGIDTYVKMKLPLIKLNYKIITEPLLFIKGKQRKKKMLEHCTITMNYSFRDVKNKGLHSRKIHNLIIF